MYPKTYQRILQPILLGTISNVLVNYVFDPDNPDFLFDEFLVAILLSIPLTELNHLIDARLERKFSWIESFGKRLILHLFLLFLSTLLALNVVGNLYVFLKGDSFYTWEETIIINVISFIVAVFLTGFSWMSFYYQRWRIAELNLNQSKKQLFDVESKLKRTSTSILIFKGQKKFVVHAKEIRQATVKHGIVRILSKSNGSCVYQGTLTELQKLLPTHLFFLAGRNMIIHRDIIRSVSSSSFGKVDIEIEGDGDSPATITVSRQKASAFRKWFNTTSTENS